MPFEIHDLFTWPGYLQLDDLVDFDPFLNNSTHLLGRIDGGTLPRYPKHSVGNDNNGIKL